MATDRFPYDLPSFNAMVRLIQENHPRFDLTVRNAEFGKPFHSPTPDSPGRTFIEVENRSRKLKAAFVYRRLDIAVSLRNVNRITVEGPITPTTIALEINRAYGMYLGKEDVLFSNHVIAQPGGRIRYRLIALPGSLVWYGEKIIEINSGDIPVNVRYLEDGTPRRLEDGNYRLLESV